ncbi:hypothetical protein AHAS_Ahas08G0089900 [Arachis hypogaea]
MHGCIGLSKCGDQDHDVKMPYPCLIIEDLHKVEKGFHREDLNCSHYSWIRTRMSFDISPGHIRNSCKKCERPNGKCGRALKCFCHPKECKDKIIPQKSGSIKSIGNNILFIFPFSHNWCSSNIAISILHRCLTKRCSMLQKEKCNIRIYYFLLLLSHDNKK